MIRTILAVLVLALAPTAASADSGKRFKSVPGAEDSSRLKQPAPRKTRKFKPSPAATSAGSEIATVPGLPPRTDDAALPADWADFFGRCLRSVADTNPLNQDGLETVGDQVVDYDTPYTKQAWLDANRDFSIQYAIKATIANEPVRVCTLQTARGRDRSADAAQAVDEGFVAWAYDMVGRGLYTSVPDPQAGTAGAEGSTYTLVSIAGNARRCRVRVVFSRTSFGNTAGLQISVEEIRNRACREAPGDLGTI